MRTIFFWSKLNRSRPQIFKRPRKMGLKGTPNRYSVYKSKVHSFIKQDQKSGKPREYQYTLVCLKLGVDFLLKNWEFRVFAKQPLSKKLGILRFRQTGHVQKIGTFIIRTGLIRNIFHPKTRSEAHFFVSLHFD